MVCQGGAGARGSAEPDEIGVDAPEVTGSLVLLGVADRTQGVMGLQDYLAERGSGKGDCRLSKDTPTRVVVIKGIRRPRERESRAVQPAETVGQLVLDRLEFADHVSELPSYLRVVEREIESALCRTLRARGASEARDVRRISKSLRLERLPDDGSAAKLNIAE